MWQIAVYVLLAYLIGSIPTGYIIAKKLKGIDIRQHGSGNVGATNVKRVIGNKAGLATLILDFLKGALTVALAMILFTKDNDPYQVAPVLAAIAAIVGHSKSIYLGFSGGKSVITSFGTIIVLEPLAAIIVGAIVFSTIKITRYVSIGSMLGAFISPLTVWLLHGELSHIVLAFFISIYIIYLHRGNIQRLLKHEENRI